MKQTQRSTDHIFLTKNTLLAPEGHTWVKVKTAKEGLIMVKPLPRLYDKRNCRAAAGVYQDMPENELGMLIANFETRLHIGRPSCR